MLRKWVRISVKSDSLYLFQDNQCSLHYQLAACIDDAVVVPCIAV